MWIPPWHQLCAFYLEKLRHHHFEIIEVIMSSNPSSVVISWVNATARADGAPLPLAQIASSNIVLVNADGSTTPVITLQGDGTSITILAPTTPGTYTYGVENVDVNGVVGALGTAAALTIADTSPPDAPTAVTAVLETPAASTQAKHS